MNQTIELECVARLPSKATAMPPLLFVHGAWHGAWCWDQGFLDYFAERGIAAYALSLRGHGGSASDKALRKLRLADYVQDVQQVIESLPNRPILVGHSMGGAVLQKCLQLRLADAGVLMASMPPSGVLSTALKLHWRRPAQALKTHFTHSLWPLVGEQAAST